jgi:hypothetical protein
LPSKQSPVDLNHLGNEIDAMFLKIYPFAIPMNLGGEIKLCVARGTSFIFVIPLYSKLAYFGFTA